MNEEARDQAHRFLRPDERLIAACGYALAPGVPQPPESLLAPPDPADLGRRIEARLPGALRQLLTSRSHDTHRSRAAGPAVGGTAHGTGMEGGWESSAGRLLIGRAGVRGSVTGVLAVTDRRWFGLSDVSPVWQNTPALRQYWEAPRLEVAALRANPAGAHPKGRMDIEFTDGSWVALLASVPAHAPAFAAAAVRFH
ncbi:hypothetical protein [Streptomyces sp. NPDC090022]|uniref:hypothetical protein n=1 Tax=Streptomyces sp. NPDC090022 TaxID=3365920 RepID=UPI00382AD546